MSDRGFRFVASTSTDVVAYRVTLSLNGSQVGSKDYPDDGSITDPNDPNKRMIDLAGDADWPGLDGTYVVDVYAIDDAGNVSTTPLEGSLTLDFVPPDPPTGFEPF